MPVTVDPDRPDGLGQAPERGDDVAELRRRLKEMESRLAAEKAAREEQEVFARSMARAARSEAAEGEALARDAAELREMLKAQHDEHAAARRELERQRSEIQAIVDAEVKKSLVPELERRLAETRTAWDEERQRERSRLAETWKHETERRIAAAKAAWRDSRDTVLDEAKRALTEDHKQQLAAARMEWEREHDSAMADRDRHWRERLDREIRETRAAMEKIWARAQNPEADDAASVGLRGMRDRLVVAAHRRRIMGYRIAILVLMLALGAAFAFRYPTLEAALTAAGADPAVTAERLAAEAAAKADAKKAAEREQDALRPLGVPARAIAPPPERPSPKAQARIKTLESELAAMRSRLEAEEKRANDAEDALGRANAAHKKAGLKADHDFRAKMQAQAKAIAELEAEILRLHTKLDAARAAATSSSTPE